MNISFSQVHHRASRRLFRVLGLLLLLSTENVWPRHLQGEESTVDPRNLRTGLPIPSKKGYCDQPYIVITKAGHWLCVLTTGEKKEGTLGQHVVSTISTDQGKSWSPLQEIEPPTGPEASWAVPLVTPSGRVYVFYDYNGDRVKTIRDKPIRADMLGWYVYKYSDDHGRTWSKERYRLPMRVTACDRTNDFRGQTQIFWGIDKPKVFGTDVMFGYTKLGKHLLDLGEGWFFRSDNLLTEPDIGKIRWQMLPDGDHGVRAPEFGSVQEEHNIVPLSRDEWYCIYRTTQGHPCQSYTRDGGRTWSRPEPATFADGRVIKHPRACPKIWRAANGNYLLWFHNHAGKSFEDRNPAWLAGGILHEGKIRWSQPEIVLYDPEIKLRTSYPDLIEQDGKYWISETQKEIARVHPIDPALLQGLWTQGSRRELPHDGLLRSIDKPARNATLDLQGLPALTGTNGFTLELRMKLDALVPGQILLDSRNPQGRGLALTTTPAKTLLLELHDGDTRAQWECDAELLKPGREQHLAIVVDAGPRIITGLIDGQLCDGGETRKQGWSRIPATLTNITGREQLQLAPRLSGTLSQVRLYSRPLRHSDLIAHVQANGQR